MSYGRVSKSSVWDSMVLKKIWGGPSTSPYVSTSKGQKGRCSKVAFYVHRRGQPPTNMAMTAEGRTDKIKLDHATGHVSLQYLACGQYIHRLGLSISLTKQGASWQEASVRWCSSDTNWKTKFSNRYQAAKSSVFLPITHNSPRQSIFYRKCVLILPNNRSYGRGINTKPLLGDVPVIQIERTNLVISTSPRNLQCYCR